MIFTDKPSWGNPWGKVYVFMPDDGKRGGCQERCRAARYHSDFFIVHLHQSVHDSVSSDRSRMAREHSNKRWVSPSLALVFFAFLISSISIEVFQIKKVFLRSPPWIGRLFRPLVCSYLLCVMFYGLDLKPFVCILSTLGGTECQPALKLHVVLYSL